MITEGRVEGCPGEETFAVTNGISIPPWGLQTQQLERMKLAVAQSNLGYLWSCPQ